MSNDLQDSYKSAVSAFNAELNRFEEQAGTKAAGERALQTVIRFAGRGADRSTNALVNLEETAKAEAAARWLERVSWSGADALSPSLVPFNETAEHARYQEQNERRRWETPAR